MVKFTCFEVLFGCVNALSPQSPLFRLCGLRAEGLRDFQGPSGCLRQRGGEVLASGWERCQVKVKILLIKSV